jgi:mono/diheme cytochrome c family protein
MNRSSLYHHLTGSAVCALILVPGAIGTGVGTFAAGFSEVGEGRAGGRSAVEAPTVREVAQDLDMRTVWDGVYTAEQAERGEQTFKRVCGYCHRDDLSGDGDVGAPALVGSGFSYRWRGLAIAEMFLTIGETMPQDAPASLTPQECLDIIGFLLQMNDMPAGDLELPLDLAELERMRFTEKP